MGPDDVFPPEPPEDFQASIDPLDDDTAERLLTGRVHPSDAPPAYAEVARVLQAAAGPPTREELAGEAAALAAFRSARESEAPAAEGRVGAGRARLVAVALAVTLAVGGLWMAAGAQTAPGLPSRFGGPGSGGSGSGTVGSGPGGSGVGGTWAGGGGSTGELRPAVPGTGPVGGERPAAVPPDRDPAGVRPGGAAGTGGVPATKAHRSHPGHPHKPPKPKPAQDKAKGGKP